MTDAAEYLTSLSGEDDTSISGSVIQLEKYDAPPETSPVTIDLKTIFLGGLFFLSVLTTCCVAAEIILPVVLAVVLKLVLEPIMRTLQKLHFPRPVAALVIIVLLFGSVVMMTMAMSNPLADWGKRLSGSVSELQQRLSFLNQPLREIHGVLQYANGLTTAEASKPVTVTVRGSELSDHILDSTRNFVGGLLETILVLFFLLTTGDTFLRRFVEILPRFQDKRHAVEISQQTETNISAYLATITLMNAMVGFGTGIVMMLCGIDSPVLWGLMAFLLNYIPMIGASIGIVIFVLVGLLSKTTLAAALLPAGCYLVLQLMESMYVTPLLLSRRFTLNPVLVILSLIFWYWMWGVPGAILSTPMLAILKIICDHIPSLKAFGHFIEG